MAAYVLYMSVWLCELSDSLKSKNYRKIPNQKLFIFITVRIQILLHVKIMSHFNTILLYIFEQPTNDLHIKITRAKKKRVTSFFRFNLNIQLKI